MVKPKTMYTHESKVRVRYGETDQMGYLYYGNYALYYEVGRAEAIRALGLSYRALEAEHGIMMPVLSLNMRFVRPALYDELLRVQTSIKSLPTQTIIFQHEIFNEKNKLVNGGSVQLAFLDQTTKKRVMAPDFLLNALKPHYS